MARPHIHDDAVNRQITDSVSQVNALVLGESASESMNMIDIVTAETLGMSMHNAVTAQQNSQMSANASITASCAKMLQAQLPPEPPAPAEPSSTIPPFMTLNPSQEKSAADFVADATKMAELAIAMMKSEQTAEVADESNLEKLIAKLKTFSPNGAKDKAANETNESPSKDD